MNSSLKNTLKQFKNKWGLNKHLPIDSVKGYDDYGQDGLWKRICKKPYKINNGERVYLDYPSIMEFTLFYRNDRLETKFYSWNKEKLSSETVIGPKCKVRFIAAWFSLTSGTFGLTLKPKLMQIMFKEKENIFNEFILDDEDTFQDVESLKVNVDENNSDSDYSE